MNRYPTLDTKSKKLTPRAVDVETLSEQLIPIRDALLKLFDGVRSRSRGEVHRVELGLTVTEQGTIAFTIGDAHAGEPTAVTECPGDVEVRRCQEAGRRGDRSPATGVAAPRSRLVVGRGGCSHLRPRRELSEPFGRDHDAVPVQAELKRFGKRHEPGIPSATGRPRRLSCAASSGRSYRREPAGGRGRTVVVGPGAIPPAHHSRVNGPEGRAEQLPAAPTLRRAC
jgi:hypothetical protein